MEAPGAAQPVPALSGQDPPSAGGCDRASRTEGSARVFAGSWRAQLVSRTEKGLDKLEGSKPSPGTHGSSGRTEAAEVNQRFHARALTAGLGIHRLNTPRLPKPRNRRRGSGTQRAKGTWCATGVKFKEKKKSVW